MLLHFRRSWITTTASVYAGLVHFYIGCFTSKSTISEFQSYAWRHIYLQTAWRRRLTYCLAPTPKTFSRALQRVVQVPTVFKVNEQWFEIQKADPDRWCKCTHGGPSRIPGRRQHFLKAVSDFMILQALVPLKYRETDRSRVCNRPRNIQTPNRKWF